MINNEITSWTQPVGSEIKGDKHGDSERKVSKWNVYSWFTMLNVKVLPEIVAYCKRFMSESRLRLTDALTVETDWETGASESSFCGSDVDAGWFPVATLWIVVERLRL